MLCSKMKPYCPVSHSVYIVLALIRGAIVVRVDRHVQWYSSDLENVTEKSVLNNDGTKVRDSELDS